MLPVERADLLLLPEPLSITTLMPFMLAVGGVGGGGLVSSADVGAGLMKRRSHCQPEVQLVVQLTLSWSCRRVVCALALLRFVLRMRRTATKRAVARWAVGTPSTRDARRWAPAASVTVVQRVGRSTKQKMNRNV